MSGNFNELDAAPLDQDDRLARQEVTLALLRFLAAGDRTPHQVGVKVLLVLHLLDRGDLTRKDLARRLGVSRQRVHQVLTRIQRKLPILSGLAPRSY